MADMNKNSDGEENGPPTPKKGKLTAPEKQKKKCKQKFRPEWLTNKDFSSWLREHETDPYKATCTLCTVTMTAEISVLKRHKEGAKHKDKIKGISQQPSISKLFDTTKIQSADKKVKRAELKLAAFMAEHKISHGVIDHLSTLLPDIFPDSNIASNLKMKHSKLQVVITNVLGVTEKETIASDLKSQKFSILVDESTDISVVKTICVVVHYYDTNIGRVVSRFWDLIQLFNESSDEHSANAEYLYKAIVKSFEEHNIPLQNIIGFGSDGCNTMMGIRNSVSSRFRISCPGIVILKCICHSLHLCASDAAKEIPPDCEQLARDVYNHFKSSSKRQSQFKAFQIFVDVDIHKILRPAQTRWLSLSSVVDRLLEQWDALRLYFDSKWLDDRECREIHKRLNDPLIKAYYYFMSWILPKFSNTNAYFQSESTVITEMHTRMRDLYKDLITLLMKPEYVRSDELDKIDPTNENNFMSLDDIYLGLGVRKQLSLPVLANNENEIRTFKHNCRKFIIRATTGIRQRYSLDDHLLQAISTLSPEACLSPERSNTLAHLFTLLPRITPKSLQEQQNIDDQWRRLPIMKENNPSLDTNNPSDIFWHQVSQLQDRDGTKPFASLANFMLEILCLPHSNADCERVFSQVNNIKTDKRNKLITKTITGNLLAEQCIKRLGKNCVDFEPQDKMMNMMNASMYKNINEK